MNHDFPSIRPVLGPDGVFRDGNTGELLIFAYEKAVKAAKKLGPQSELGRRVGKTVATVRVRDTNMTYSEALRDELAAEERPTTLPPGEDEFDRDWKDG